MPLNPAQLQKDIDSIIKDAATKAFAAVNYIDLPKVNTEEYMSEKQIKNAREKQIKLTSEKFGEVFAKESSKKLMTAIDSYVRSITLVPVLVSATGGPVSGTITIA